MNPQFEHTLVSSFYLWFENQLISDKIGAYTTGNANNFYPVTVNEVPNDYIAYQGEFRQLVADNSISQPNTGYIVNGSSISADYSQSNVYVDYYNGRLIFPQASGSGLNITSTSSVKEINVYTADDGDENIIFHSQFFEQGQANTYLYNRTGSLDEDTYILPACFISLVNGKNEPLCFGGEENTKNRVQVMVVATDNYYLDGILGAFKDTERGFFRHVDFQDFPYGQFFSLKSYPYSYTGLIESRPKSSSNFCSIEKVMVSKLRNSVEHAVIGRSLKIGYIDFDLSTHRYP